MFLPSQLRESVRLNVAVLEALEKKLVMSSCFSGVLSVHMRVLLSRFPVVLAPVVVVALGVLRLGAAPVALVGAGPVVLPRSLVEADPDVGSSVTTLGMVGIANVDLLAA